VRSSTPRPDIDSLEPGPVLLYDGLCVWCNLSARLLLQIDRRGSFRFASLQGELGRVVSQLPELEGVDSLVLLEPAPDGFPGRVHVRSDAFFRILEHLGGIWRVYMVFRVIPRPLRDLAYDVFARLRYVLFPRFDECPLPPAEARDRFLD
jgi:predicted DCC family thiol-disulfide oxidoreductase YuxK